MFAFVQNLQMKENSNLHSFLIFLDICVFSVVILSRRSSAADYRYKVCGPRNCGKGPNIRYPFYIQGQQESYCGFPGFKLNCSPNGHPVLQLPENVFVIENISYETQSFRVYDSAVSSSHNNGCVPRIRNTTLPPIAKLGFADNVTMVKLFSNCSNSLSRKHSRDMVFCDANDRVLPLFEKNENITNALENCATNVVAPVEDDGNIGMGNLEQVLRRGFVIDWNASDCSACSSSGGHCGFNETNLLFKCFCPDRPHSVQCGPDAEKDQSTLILTTAILGAGVFLLLCLLITVIIWRCKKGFNTSCFFPRNISSDRFTQADLEGGKSYFGIPIFSYKQLLEATNNFDSSNELGDGGYGTVYYGKLCDGREVAVKRLYEHNYRRVEQFMNEIKILTSLRHKNLVSLYGCTSRESKELLLVYEYVPNGTVADHLHGEKANEASLNWAVRMKIAIETASALAYLHKSDIIHRDVKTSNLLLDNNFCVKVADFGLSRLFPNDVTHISTAPQGTAGYVDPNYHQCYQLTDKSDVYSFGVVLTELISSMPAVDISRHTNEINLANLAVNRIQRCAFDELIDSSLGYESDVEVTRMTTSVAELAFRCLQLEKDMRPSMDEVSDLLKEIQSGDILQLQMEKEASDNICVAGEIPPSPETDDIVLLKSKKFQSSPNAVTDIWVSSSTTTRTSYHKSVEFSD